MTGPGAQREAGHERGSGVLPVARRIPARGGTHERDPR